MSLERLANHVQWSVKVQSLKELLVQPLPGGRGFQEQRDRKIQELCREISELELPRRY